VITLVNQGHDDARDAAYNITRLFQIYVHRFDVMEYSPLGFALVGVVVAGVSVFALVAIIIVVKRR
jgi:hypothetical protein